MLVLVGCANAPPARQTYEQLGRRAGIQAIVDDLLEVILEDDRINYQFASTDIFRFRKKLAEQLCVESGGPCVYTGRTMQEAHVDRGIDDAQFNGLVEDLVLVMERRRIPVAAQNQLLRRLALMHVQIAERAR